MSNEYVDFKLNFLSEGKDLHELTLIENKNKTHLLFKFMKEIIS
jgi:hypothetical protein